MGLKSLFGGIKSFNYSGYRQGYPQVIPAGGRNFIKSQKLPI
jgi:hypothetical protein